MALDEAHRQRELDTYRITDTLPEVVFDDIVRLASRLCDAPVAMVSLIDRDRQWFKARVGMEPAQTDRELAFCDHAIREPDMLLEVRDARHDARFADNPLVDGPMGIRFYAGMPLVTPQGAAVGTVCVIDREPRELDDAQREALASLARITMNLLEARRRLMEVQRRELLKAAPTALAPDPVPGYAIAIIEAQGHAAQVAQRGHHLVEQQLQRYAKALEALLHEGEQVSRVSGAAEFVLTLRGDADERRLQAFEAAAQDSSPDCEVVCAMAASESAGESPLLVFDRADRQLTQRKDARAGMAH